MFPPLHFQTFSWAHCRHCSSLCAWYETCFLSGFHILQPSEGIPLLNPPHPQPSLDNNVKPHCSAPEPSLTCPGSLQEGEPSKVKRLTAGPSLIRKPRLVSAWSSSSNFWCPRKDWPMSGGAYLIPWASARAGAWARAPLRHLWGS